MNAILDALEPQRSEKGTRLSVVSEAKVKRAGAFRRGEDFGDLPWRTNKACRPGTEKQTLPQVRSTFKLL